MARKNQQSAPEQVEEPGTEQAPNVEAAPAAVQAQAPARPPQGIVIRHLNTGNPVVDFHKKWRKLRKIDPESLIVDGKQPLLALPVDGQPGKSFKRVNAEHAAEMLLCDFVTGGQSIYRLATDAEVEAYEARMAELAKVHGPKK